MSRRTDHRVTEVSRHETVSVASAASSARVKDRGECHHPAHAQQVAAPLDRGLAFRPEHGYVQVRERCHWTHLTLPPAGGQGGPRAAWRAAEPPRSRAAVIDRTAAGCYIRRRFAHHGGVAQMVEHAAHIRSVKGSSPLAARRHHRDGQGTGSTACPRPAIAGLALHFLPAVIRCATLCAGERPRAMQMIPQDPPQRQIRVLAADDDEANLVVLGALLRADGHRVFLARSGAECIDIARKVLPDIILLDVEMPGMGSVRDGSRARGPRADEDHPHRHGDGPGPTTGTGSGALRAGAVDFLTRPVQPEELTAKVRSLARLKAYGDDMKRQRTELLAEVAGKSEQLKAALESFSRFVPREFLRCLSKKSIVDIALGDQVLADMAILFSDIRSFTALSEKMSPQQNFNFLNSYLKRMNPFIWENDGFIDKYIGDAIMALFPSGAASALNAAIAMLAYIPEYNAQRASLGYEPIRIGIGIHAGSVMLGIIGHERFLQGTVISDAVNLASRLEELTKVYGVSLVVSNTVLFGLADPNRYHYRFLDRVRVKGKVELVSVYEVYDGDPPLLVDQKDRTRELFQKGVFEYHAGNFQEAMQLFESSRMPALTR